MFTHVRVALRAVKGRVECASRLVLHGLSEHARATYVLAAAPPTLFTPHYQWFSFSSKSVMNGSTATAWHVSYCETFFVTIGV